jgi:hypothetical protein
MVPQKPEYSSVNQRPGSLHFNVPEGIVHKAHHDPEVNKKPLVLLGFDIPGKHEGITPIVPAELQPFDIVIQIQIVKRKIFLKLIFIQFTIGAHF